MAKGNGTKSTASTIPRGLVDRVRAEFMGQGLWDSVAAFLDHATDFTAADKAGLLELAERDAWEAEWASWGDVARRAYDERLERELRQAANAGVRIGRKRMVEAAGNMMKLGERALNGAFQAVPKRASGAPMNDAELPFDVHKFRMEVLEKYGRVMKTAQDVMAGALGLQDALARALDVDDVDALVATADDPELKEAVEELRGLARDVSTFREHAESGGNGKVEH